MPLIHQVKSAQECLGIHLSTMAQTDGFLPAMVFHSLCWFINESAKYKRAHFVA